jgi:ribose 5-phosphate isomerase B
MRIAISADHRGYHVKERLVTFLTGLGHEVIDCGCPSEKPCDYPDVSLAPCLRVRRGQADRAILLCGTGIGMTMTANKVAGIRAALCHDELTAEMSRRHNDANVLCLAADLLGDELMHRMIRVWLETPFDGGRHDRRVKKIMAAERYLADDPPDEAACAEARQRRRDRAARRKSL